MIRISVVGIGMGALGTETAQAREAICNADVLVGAGRMLEAARALVAEAGSEQAAEQPAFVELFSAQSIIEHLEGIAEGPGDCCDDPAVAVICSGDTGFFSLATSLVEQLRASGLNYELDLIPGISTVQYLAAKLGKPWQDCNLVSAHGRDVNIVGEVLCAPETFFLTGGDVTPNGIARQLADAGLGSVEMVVAERLSYPDERITCATAADIVDAPCDSLAAVWVTRGELCDSEVAPFAGFPGIPDDLFIRGKVPMTKRDVRAAIAARIRPRADETIVDIGAGTGSVSIELACLEPRARVVAIEEKPEACELIRANRERFGAYNVEVVEGRAPEALAACAAFDTAFIGGSSGELEPIVAALLAVNPAARIVMTAVTLETLAQATDLFGRLQAEGALASCETVQLSVSRARAVGRYHLLDPESPVFIIEAEGAGERP